MAEAAAHGASYLSWPTWPEAQRKRMTDGIRPQADLLRDNAHLLNAATPRTEAVLFLPFRQWVEKSDCQPLGVARLLGQANVQFKVVSEEDLNGALTEAGARTRVLLAESPEVFTEAEKKLLEAFHAAGGRIVWTGGGEGAWLADLRKYLSRPAVVVAGPPTLRAVVRDLTQGRTVVHLLNLNVQRLSSFEDKVTPARDISLEARVPFAAVKRVSALSADDGATLGELPVRFTSEVGAGGGVLRIDVAAVVVSTMLLIEAAETPK
jgi:hypothetical protein